MTHRLVRLVCSRPRRVLLAALAFLIVAGVLGGPVAGLLSTGDDFSDPNAEAVLARAQLERAAGVEPDPSIVALVRPRGGDVRSASGREAVARVARRLAADPDIARTLSIADTRDPSFVSRAGDATYVLGFVRAQGDEADAGERIAEAFAAADDGVIVGGAAVANPAVGEQVSEDLARAELIAFPVLFLLSLWVFRGVVAALVPLGVGLLTIMGTFLGLRLINEVTLLSIFALNLSVALGLGLSIDYSLFVVSRFREELARGAEVRAAVATTLSTAGRTVLFSGVTVAAALSALVVFPQRFLYSMGIAGAIGALLAVLVSVTVLPALLVVLGRRIDALAPPGLRHTPGATDRGFWYRLSHGVMRRPLAVAVVTAVVLIAAGIPFARIAFTGVDASVLSADSPAKQVDTAVRTEFPPAPTDPVLVAVSASPDAGDEVAAFAARLRALPSAEAVAPPRPLAGSTWQIDVRPRAPVLDERTLDLVDAVRAVPAPAPVLVGGASARFVDQQDDLAERLPLALAILAVTTLVILFLMTGSVVLPVKTLIMNLLTLSATFGLLVLVFQDGRLEGLLAYESQGALEATQPLVLLAVAFALSTDYGVFLLTRIKEAHDAGASNEEAVALGLQRTGRIVTAAALLLCVALGAFALSEIVFIKQVGLGTAVAVIIDATLVRALLVPALMRLLGEWNWWAPAPLRRIHERLGLREGGPPLPAG
ncbi:MAG: MMPL family transporter [Solirubrobacterales bacterium]|nr:MMPL family transporter [Solirubrobacterales bacterium]